MNTNFSRTEVDSEWIVPVLEESVGIESILNGLFIKDNK